MRTFVQFNSSDSRVTRAATPGAVHSGLILSRVKPTTLKLLFTASLFKTQLYMFMVENKPASLLAPLVRHLAGFLHLRAVDRWPAIP